MTKKLTEALKSQKKSTEQKNLQIVGTLGIPLGGQRLVEVANRKSFVYVKLRDNQNEVIQAFNNKVAPSYGLPVIVARRGGRYVVLDVDTVRYQSNWNSFAPFLPAHGNTHSFDPDNSGGGDVVWVHSRQLMPSLIIPSGTLGAPNVLMSSYVLQNNNGSFKYTGNTGTAQITPYRPTSPSGTTLVLIYLDALTGNPGLLFATGTFVQASITGTSQLAPFFPSITNPFTQIPLSVVRLVTGTTSIKWDNIYDVRQWIHAMPTGTSGGGGSSTGTNYDDTYLRLDTANNPLTGGLEIRPTASNINGFILVQETDLVSPFVVNHTATPSGTMGNSFRFNRTEDWGNETIIGEAIQVSQTWNLSRITPNSGGFLSFYSNDILRASLDPSANGTGTMALFDGDFSLSDNGNLLLLKNNGSPRTKIAGQGNLEFGLNVAKESNAGKIGYQLFDAFFDIVGAGTSGGNRWVKIYDKLNGGDLVQANGYQNLGLLSKFVYLNATGSMVNASNASGKTFITGSDNFMVVGADNESYLVGAQYAIINLSADSPRVYTATGTHTWNKPDNLRYVIVEMVGGGGGGGGAEGSVSNAAGAAGGGGAGYSKKKIAASALASSVTITVGGGGAGGPNTPSTGATGGQSSFGSHCSANGGAGGGAQNAGTTAAFSTSGLGGSATGGDINITGKPGLYGTRLDATASISGEGGASLLGFGARPGVNANADGADAGNYGGGGSGARTSNSATDRPGGDGGDGVVIVWEYITGNV